jgi:hypothetical protein
MKVAARAFRCADFTFSQGSDFVAKATVLERRALSFYQMPFRRGRRQIENLPLTDQPVSRDTISLADLRQEHHLELATLARADSRAILDIPVQ